MIDLLNKGYPHLKIPKSGNKKEIIERIISANTFIASMSSKDKSSSSNQENTGNIGLFFLSLLLYTHLYIYDRV